MSKSTLLPRNDNNIVMRDVTVLIVFLATLGLIAWLRRRSG